MPRRSRSRVAAILVVACSLLAACGSRVVPLSAGEFGNGGTQPGATASNGAVLPGASTGPSSSAAPGQPGTQPSPIISGLPTNCRGGAADTGVTATTVKIGLIYGHTGPLPGQFDSAAEAVDSYVRAVNDAGGVCGRKFQLITGDDQENGSTDLSLATKMATEDKVFAFVGSVSAPDDSGIAKVSKQYKIPDLGFPLSWERADNPYTYGVPGQLRKNLIGIGANGSQYLDKRFGIKQLAVFWLNESEVSEIEAWAFEAAMEYSSGGTIKICHEQPSGVVDNNYTNYVISMEGDCPASKGPLAVYSTMENNANVKLANAMQGQNFKPAVFAPTFTSYLPDFINNANVGSDGKRATEGAFIAMPQIPFERLQTPPNTWDKGTHELNTYMTTLHKYYPNPHDPGSFGAPEWGTAALFFEGVKACGAQLTRACLFHFLDTAPAFSDNEFLSPTVPHVRQIYSNDLLVQVVNGKFTEVRPTDRSGPPGGPDFWDRSQLFDWQNYFCHHQDKFPNSSSKKSLLDEC